MNDPDQDAPRTSAMHQHAVSALMSEVSARADERAIRVLDVGCGDGRLMAMVGAAVSKAGRGLEIHGLDVNDSDVQAPGFLDRTRDFLSSPSAQPGFKFELHQVNSSEPWPFANNYFDYVVSNQVGEHVEELDRFLSECNRVSADGGVGIHVFPLVNFVVEGHTGVPFGHRILSNDLREWYFRLFASVGLSRIGPLRLREGESSSAFARSRSDYIQYQTSYVTWKRLAASSAKNGFRSSYRYSTGVYLLRLLGAESRLVERYYFSPHPLLDLLAFPIVKRVASITLFLEKGNDFDPELN